MAYRALYREWRPKDFSHVVGQAPIIGTLRNQVVTNRIAHAYLFCGSRGTGKTSTAKILAKAINCLQPENGDPCGKCENCLRADNEETLDVIEIDAASNNGVDEMRELRDTVKYPPQYGKYKVYIIDEVHMLSTSAFNALLKTLEEPPAHIVFILATTEPQKLPETILSRCQRFDFGRIPSTEIAGRLKEAAEGSGAQVSDGALMMIARAADGGMRDALSILDMCLGYSDQVDEELVRNILGTSDTSFLFEFSKALSEQDASKVYLMIDRLMRDGKDPAVFAKDVCRHIRALLIAKTSPEDVSMIMDISGDEAAEYVRQSESMTVSRLMKILDLFMALETEMRYASTPRMALENASIKSCLRIEETDSQALNDRIIELEKRIDGLMRNPAAAAAAQIPVEETKTTRIQQPREERKVPQAAGRENSGNHAAVWKELMNTIRGKDMTAWSFLSQGRMIGCKNGRYLWQADRKEAEVQFITVLNMPERNKTICECLQQITGQACSFSAVPQGKSSETADNSGDDEYLESIYETFGKEPVNIVDEI
ncbi:DNA polymerase III subunit gamma/tau [Aristaeella hokkaidonensis]|uniref:DNA polymerase III subunit gamma/tau n=1 Tax=Aristaeella hokkaidonensis TaxID=3046382 RepID=A0AC61MY75_9FIRM|nr:DNA polymerase III subunit gamma/tau [Aristaeella hokkaidonensis]QUC67926.1 DNA polymerase III subunit gamma/tau [Aristaeella hokkaidonensis]SNT92993.1 DNA polymerase-3 subunit gamma/tau [Aristaeella hokkaidonensis]